MSKLAAHEAAEAVTGWQVVQLLWPFLDLLYHRVPAVAAMPYCADFEAEADAAIDAWSGDEADTLTGLSDGAWRVLLERHLQLLDVALAGDAVESPLMRVPRGLTLGEQRAHVARELLARRSLPWPAADRSGFLPRQLAPWSA